MALARIRAWLCRRGLHAWRCVGYADYGRGRLDACSRVDCDSVRRVELSPEKLAQVLADDKKKISSRQKQPEVDHELEAQIRAVGDRPCKEPQEDARGYARGAQEAPEPWRPACELCFWPISHAATSRCPHCGTAIRPRKRQDLS